MLNIIHLACSWERHNFSADFRSKPSTFAKFTLFFVFLASINFLCDASQPNYYPGTIVALPPLMLSLVTQTFTAWVNNHLRVRKQQVNDMQEDFEDGLLLISLLELISAKDLGKYNLKPKIRAQKLENCNTALQFVKSEGIKLVNIGSEVSVTPYLLATCAMHCLLSLWLLLCRILSTRS
jgi:hypothetical protein